MALRGMNFGAFPVYEIFLLNKKALHNGRVNSCRNIDWCRQVRQLNISWHFSYKKGEYCGKSKKHSFFL